jgi:iron complex transport system ATP-binding protein
MEIHNVVFSYDKKTDQLKGVSGSVPKGKITTIIGPNGCGKSTLLGVMSGNHLPGGGQAVLDGKAIHHYKPKELARKLAVVHQQNGAPSDMTVERLVAYGRMPYRTMFGGDREEDERAVDWALSCTNLEAKRKLPIDRLSGGERQRVWVAMALAQKTPILFLDEPTTYLDIYYQLEMLEFIRELNRKHGLTIVMVLHDINQAIRYSDRIIAMKDGRIVAAGEPEDVITERAIREIYGVEAIVRREPEAGLHVILTGIRPLVRP